MAYEKKGYANTYSDEKQKKMQSGRLATTKKKQALFLKMYPKFDCNLTATCKAMGMNVQTVRQWKCDYPEFRQACDDAYVTVVNKAEAKLQSLIDKGNPAAIMFFLKCKGGYQENAKIDINANVVSKQLVLNIDPFSVQSQKQQERPQTITIDNDSTNNGIE